MKAINPFRSLAFMVRYLFVAIRTTEIGEKFDHWRRLVGIIGCYWTTVVIALIPRFGTFRSYTTLIVM